jgi:hypothetical protein
MMKKYLYIITSFLLLSGIAYAYYGGSSGVMTDTNCNQAQYFNIGVLCQDADDGKLYKGTGSAIEQIQAYDADLDTWSDITPSTDVQAFLGAANDTAARTELGLGTLATQNADNATITGGNVTGLTNLVADNLTVTSTANVTGVSTANVINASGLVSANAGLRAVPTATNPVMIGNTTPVNTSTGATFPTATKTQISKASAFTNAAVGDLIIVTGGTGATTGQYRLTTKTSNDLVVVDRNIHASGTDITDGAFTIYKDVVTVSPTDATNGQLINAYSHTNKPLQIGGSTFAATGHNLTNTGTIFGGDVELNGATWVDGYMYFTSEMHMQKNLISFEDGGGPVYLRIYSVADDGFHLCPVATNDSGNHNIIITSGANYSKDHDHETASTNPTLFVHSATDPDSDNTQWMSLTHDTADGVLNAGKGGIRVQPAQITAGSGTGVTVNTNGNIAQQVYKVTTTYAAYSDSDLTKGIVIATLPAKTRLVAAYADTTQAYAGTDITAATLEVGITAEGAAEILATGNVFAGAILLGDADAEMGTAMTRAAKEQGAYMPSFTGTTAIYATIDATTGAATTLANLTAGSTTFYIVTERLP